THEPARLRAMAKGAWMHLGVLVVAGCVSAGCTAAGTHHARQPAAARTSASASPGGVIGSPGNPLRLSCGQSASGDTSSLPGPQDLVAGPLDIIGGKVLATADPAGYGDHGSYK